MSLMSTARSWASDALGRVAIPLARRVTLPGRPKLIPFAIEGDDITLPSNDMTGLHGEYGIWVNEGRGHLLVGDVIDDSSAQVRRELLAATGDISAATEGRWSGHTFPSRHSLGLDVSEVTLANGRSAWFFPGDDDDRWAIHIHGVKSARASALRGVPQVHGLGFTSLVPAFYGEAEPGTAVSEGTTFGLRESADIAVAVRYAVDRGAKSILLVGWSMGAEIALRLASSAEFEAVIEGVVAIGPALDWRASIGRAMSRAKLPRPLRSAVFHILEHPSLSRRAGMDRPANFSEVDWIHPTRQVPVRTLIIHSSGDSDASFDDTVALARRNPDTVTLVEFPAVPHLMEWNSDRERFESAVIGWLEEASHPQKRA